MLAVVQLKLGCPNMRRLEPKEYSDTWNVFDETFKFRPSVSGPFPAISEPERSITFRIREQFDENHLDEFRETIFGAFSVVVGDAEEIYYLDWQHECYGIHINGETTWVSGYPDGDYSILLSKDMKIGTFGHPWEQSICLFGDLFVEEVLKKRPYILEAAIRNNGAYLLKAD